MRKVFQILVGCALILFSGISIAGERFDGNWRTKLTSPPTGNTEGYTWEFPSTIQKNNYHGERGTAGEPGYLVIVGTIAEDGSAKLAANGIVASRKYARGILAHSGAEYGYNIKAQFNKTEGNGLRDKGLGVEGRPCTFEFVKERATAKQSDGQ
jgi:hypothetical protein